MIRLRLRTRLAIWFAASVLLILAPFLAGLLVVEWRSMRAALDHHLQEDLEVAAEMLVVRDQAVAWRTDAGVDLGYDAGPQRWVEAYGADGALVFARGRATMPALKDILAVASRGTEGYATLQTPAGAHVRSLIAERTVGDRPLWLRVVRAEDGLRTDFSRLVIIVSLVAPLAVCAAALAGYVISGRALAPLGRMAERARSISADRLDERLPVENPDDELGLLAGVFNDTFARLDASFKRLRQFSADVSHELRTPLTAIRSVGEVGLRAARDSNAYQEIIGSMLEEADRLARVVDTLLTLSRWESGRVRPATSPVDLRTLTEEVVAHLSVLSEERGLTIDVSLPEPLVASADPVMARQAVINVVDNAIKFTRRGGGIRISSRTSPTAHQLIVDDEGPGIPVEYRARVLERFYRVDRGRDDGPQGTGLGLSIVHWAMTANRGRVEFDDNDAGGCRVVLTLPRF